VCARVTRACVRDAASKPIAQQNANGTWVSYSYDDAGRLTLLANLKSDNTTLSSFLYSLDNVGNRAGVQEANGDVVTWSYDNTYQLTREQRYWKSEFLNAYIGGHVSYAPGKSKALGLDFRLLRPSLHVGY